MTRIYLFVVSSEQSHQGQGHERPLGDDHSGRGTWRTVRLPGLETNYQSRTHMEACGGQVALKTGDGTPSGSTWYCRRQTAPSHRGRKGRRSVMRFGEADLTYILTIHCGRNASVWCSICCQGEHQIKLCSLRFVIKEDA